MDRADGGREEQETERACCARWLGEDGENAKRLSWLASCFLYNANRAFIKGGFYLW